MLPPLTISQHRTPPLGLLPPPLTSPCLLSQMYDENYNAVAGLRDHQITPVSGLNPWAQPVKDKAENGTKHH